MVEYQDVVGIDPKHFVESIACKEDELKGEELVSNCSVEGKVEVVLYH